MIHEAELFVLAEQVAVEVLSRVRPEHRNIKVPPLHDLPGADHVTVASVVRDHARDDAWVPDLLAGRTMDEIGRDRYAGDLLGSDPVACLARLGDAAVMAARKATDGAAVVHTGAGDLSTSEYLLRGAIARTFAAHEVAVHIGSVCPLTEELARKMWERTEPESERWRSLGIFGAPLLPVPDDVSWRDRYLMAAGRDPHPLWDR
jgi:hypothetical protein